MGIVKQVFCSSVISCLNICLGLVYGWPSSTLRLFELKNTTLNRPMTDSELALIGSLPSIGAFIATPLTGIFLDRIGRKTTAVLYSSFSMLGWCLISFSHRVEIVLVGVFANGCFGAVYPITTVFVSEICQESIRGAMISVATLFYSLGLLISYFLGGILEYYMMNYAILGINVAVVIAISLLKESPTHLMAKNQTVQAAKSLTFYRGIKLGSKEEEYALNQIMLSLNPQMDDNILAEEEKLKTEHVDPRKMGVCQFLKNFKSTRRALVMVLIITMLSIFQGQTVLQVYAEPLFKDAVPNISANNASMCLAVLSMAIVFVAGYLTDVAGRRPLMIYASLVTGLSALMLGLQIQLNWGPSWLIAANIYFYTFAYSLGAGTVPWVLLGEVFLPQVRSVLTMVVYECVWLSYCVMLFIFNPLEKAIGLGPVFYIFSIIAFSTAVYSVIYLPETKGVTVIEIQNQFSKPIRKS